MTSFLMVAPNKENGYVVLGAVSNGFSVSDIRKLNQIDTMGCNSGKTAINGLVCDKKFQHFAKNNWFVVESATMKI